MTTELVIQYCIYGAIIVIGILVLGLIRRKNRLPSHAELKAKISSFGQQLRTLFSLEGDASLNAFDFYKRINKLLYLLDKIILNANLISEKERDMEIASIATALENARKALAPYKIEKRVKDDPNGMQSAILCIDEAVVILEQVLVRDKGYKTQKK